MFASCSKVSYLIIVETGSDFWNLYFYVINVFMITVWVVNWYHLYHWGVCACLIFNFVFNFVFLMRIMEFITFRDLHFSLRSFVSYLLLHYNDEYRPLQNIMFFNARFIIWKSTKRYLNTINKSKIPIILDYTK